MAQVSSNDAAAALRILADTALRRENAIQAYDNAPNIASDDEQDSDAPIFESFYSTGGSASIAEMINFSPKEFQTVWNVVCDIVMTCWNVGRGRKSTMKGKDMLFMMLTVMKHGGKWDFLGQMFKIKGPTFEKMIVNFMHVVGPPLVSGLIEDIRKERRGELVKKFVNFPYASYATDVTFQQCNRPSGNMAEGKKYFSGKHHLYGYKVEASVGPDGICLGFTKHYAGAVADIDIFHKNSGFHRGCLRKERDERMTRDDGILSDKYPNHWAVIVDKGYQGAAEFMRVIHPRKKPAHRMLRLCDEQFNEEVATDRIIVENYFGRLCQLWSVLALKYRWSESLYDLIFSIGISLTNLHVSLLPLRQEDGDHYGLLRKRLFGIGDQITRKRKRAQDKYRQRRKQRLDLQFREMNDSDQDGDTTESPTPSVL